MLEQTVYETSYGTFIVTCEPGRFFDTGVVAKMPGNKTRWDYPDAYVEDSVEDANYTLLGLLLHKEGF